MRLSICAQAAGKETQAMTLLEAYVFIGIPLIALAMAGGALWLTSWSRAQLDVEQPGPGA